MTYKELRDSINERNRRRPVIAVRVASPEAAEQIKRLAHDRGFDSVSQYVRSLIEKDTIRSLIEKDPNMNTAEWSANIGVFVWETST